MADGASGEARVGEQSELEALRRRAYGPDADIHGDSTAVARLLELEDRARIERFPLEIVPPPIEPAPASTATPSVIVVDAARPPAARWHSGLIAAAAVTAVLLGGAAWSSAQAPQAAGLPSANAKTAAVANEKRAAGYEGGYRVYMDGLREDVLTLPGSEEVATLLIRDQLRPYGILYGRTVGAGPTLDHEFCMIIADLPRSSITCIPIENASATPVSVTLPAWYSDAESDMFTGLGEPVTYTLMPGGGVVAMPADAAAAVVAPTPSATAVPPPGWQ